MRFDQVFRGGKLVTPAGIVDGDLGIVGDRIADIGCGTGYNTRHLAARMPNSRFIGLDLSRSHVDAAHRAAKGLANATFETGDFQQLPYSDRAFDAVLAVESLCQSSDMRLAIGEAFRVLRPGGCFLVIQGLCLRGELVLSLVAQIF